MSGRMPRNEFSDDEDDFMVPENINTSAVGNRLGSLFSHAGKVDGNSSLTYKAPKQPVLKEEPSKSDQKVTTTDADGAPVRVLFAAAPHAFLWKDAQYVPQGKIGVAVLGNRIKKDYKILLYQSNKQPIGQAAITVSLNFNVSTNNYVSFLDERSISWSLAFDNENQLLDFLKWVMAIKGLLSDEHHKEILLLNTEEGEGESVGEGDSLEIEYTEFIVEDGPNITEFNGTLNSNQKPLRVKLGKGEAPKECEGWMDGLLGMRKRGKRLFVIPPDLGYSGHDSSPSFPTNTPLMVYAIIKRVKFSKKRTDETVAIRERKLSTDSAVSSNLDVSMRSSPTPSDAPSKEKPIEESAKATDGPQKSSSDSGVDKKVDLISRMAKIGHAVMGAAPFVPPVAVETFDHVLTVQKPIAPPRPSTLQNPLAVVCADLSLATATVTQTAAVTKSSSDESISSHSRASVAPVSTGAPSLPIPSYDPSLVTATGAMPLAYPPIMSTSTAAMPPYMFPFAYPAHFFQAPFLPPTIPPPTSGTSDFGSLSTSSTGAFGQTDRQAVMEEIQKSHLHLQDALTKTLVTNFGGVLKKLTDLSENLERKSDGKSKTESMPDVVAKLDRIEAMVQGYSQPNLDGLLEKVSKLGDQLNEIGSIGPNIPDIPAMASSDERSVVVERLETLTEQVSSLRTTIEKMTHTELVAGGEWKEKYEKLKTQAISMKEKYEERIQELEENAASRESSDGAENAKVKKIMNSFFKTVSQRFPNGENFDSETVRRIVLETVKESTLNALNDSNSTEAINANESAPSFDADQVSSESPDHSSIEETFDRSNAQETSDSTDQPIDQENQPTQHLTDQSEDQEADEGSKVDDKREHELPIVAE